MKKLLTIILLGMGVWACHGGVFTIDVSQLSRGDLYEFIFEQNPTPLDINDPNIGDTDTYRTSIHLESNGGGDPWWEWNQSPDDLLNAHLAGTTWDTQPFSILIPDKYTTLQLYDSDQNFLSAPIAAVSGTYQFTPNPDTSDFSDVFTPAPEPSPPTVFLLGASMVWVLTRKPRYSTPLGQVLSTLQP